MFEAKDEENEKERKTETQKVAQGPEVLRLRGPTPGTSTTVPTSNPPQWKPELHQLGDYEKPAPS